MTAEKVAKPQSVPPINGLIIKQDFYKFCLEYIANHGGAIKSSEWETDKFGSKILNSDITVNGFQYSAEVSTHIKTDKQKPYDASVLSLRLPDRTQADYFVRDDRDSLTSGAAGKFLVWVGPAPIARINPIASIADLTAKFDDLLPKKPHS